MDHLDRKILAIVQRDCASKAEAIAETVGLSASAVQRRLRALRSAGVIRAEVAVIDPKAIAGTMTFIAGLEIERENYGALQKLRRWAEGCDHVQQLYYVTGGFDLVAIILASDVEAYDMIAAALMRDNPLIRRMTTNVVLRAEKVGLEVPLAEE
ncbi:Lrp/AsnC family transcriptional regulator [Pseudogemmobacter sonorensis]|uniref:Lrp/AsnC family transcriptional regulator n=1 Tax=Pseudogemmobacter sonorensis TaxID=2989681 RepID=UPI003678C3D0